MILKTKKINKPVDIFYLFCNTNYMRKIILGFLMLFFASVSTTQAANFYLSRNGDNSSGTSWETAWNEFGQVDWEKIGPGDTLHMDGGPSESEGMVYREVMDVEASGEPGNPVTLKLSSEPGRNGKVISRGVHSDAEIQAPCKVGSEDSKDYAGFFFNQFVHDIVIDGTKRGGIEVKGHSRYGVMFTVDKNSEGSQDHRNRDDYSENITLRYMNIFGNGNRTKTYAGVRFAGVGHKFEYVEIHDNAHSAIETNFISGNIINIMNDVTISNSWIYNQSSECGKDGVEMNTASERVDGFTVQNSIFGPNLRHGLTFGNSAIPDNVVIDNSVFTGFDGEAIQMRDSASNYQITNTTINGQNADLINLEGSGHGISDSVFVGGSINVPGGTNSSNNCTYQTSGSNIGTENNPQFANAGSYQPTDNDVENNFANTFTADFTVGNEGCKGSSMTSVADMYNSQGGNGSGLEGDINGDCAVNLADITSLQASFTSLYNFSLIVANWGGNCS